MVRPPGGPARADGNPFGPPRWGGVRALLALLLLVSSAAAAVWFGALPPGSMPPA